MWFKKKKKNTELGIGKERVHGVKLFLSKKKKERAKLKREKGCKRKEVMVRHVTKKAGKVGSFFALPSAMEVFYFFSFLFT